jgi:hypothetical protein
VHTIGVTVVGEFDAQAAGARDAVTGALRSAGYRVRLVGGAPGTFAESPTPAMAERLCSLFHMDLVAVVHPGAGGLVVELLDRTGAVVGRPAMAPRPAVPAVQPPAAAPAAQPEPGVPVSGAPAYDDSALRQAIPTGAHSIGLTVVGAPGTGAAAARDAVVSALRATGRQVRLVGAGGTLAEPPTAGVVERLCSLYQMDLVAVVWRGPTSLGVQLLDRTGTVVGHPVMTARAAAPVTSEPEPAAPADPRLHLGEELYASGQVTMAMDGSAYQGRDKRPLRGADFYATVGRPDLAEEYRRREQNKGGAYGVGGVILGVGVIWGIADLLYSATAAVASPVPCLLSGGAKDDWCHPHQPSPLPWGAAVLGLGVLVIPAATPSDPLPEPERRRLMERHNADLRARAGLGSVRVAPVVSADGGGMVLSGSF